MKNTWKEAHVSYTYRFDILAVPKANPVDRGRKLNVHKTFRRCPGRLLGRPLNVLCTFNLRLVFTGMLQPDPEPLTILTGKD